MYAKGLPRKAPQYRRVVGIDLGTNTGVAFCDVMPGVPVASALIVGGQWSLAVGPYDTGPLRHIRFKQFLSILAPDCILFEDVKFTPPISGVRTSPAAIIARAATASEFLGGLKATLTTWAEECGIPAEGVGIRVIKKWLTGVGNANKVKMIEAANERFGTSLDPENYDRTGVDNIADALALCGMGVELYSEGL